VPSFQFPCPANHCHLPDFPLEEDRIMGKGDNRQKNDKKNKKVKKDAKKPAITTTTGNR